MPTPICEVPLLTALALRAPKLTLEPVAAAQLDVVMPDVPVQNVRDSLTSAVTVIC